MKLEGKILEKEFKLTKTQVKEYFKKDSDETWTVQKKKEMQSKI